MFIYDFPTPNEPLRPRLRSALIQAQPILNVRWNPNPKRAGSLALCCGGGGLYTWSNEWSTDDTETKGGEEEMAECIGVPTSKSDYLCVMANFFSLMNIQEKLQVRDVRWSADGKGLILMDKEAFCCAFEVTEE